MFDPSPTLSTYTCTSCDKIITVKTKFGKIVEVAVPGVAVVTGGIAILDFLGVEDFGDLIDMISDSA
jgi:hypothetical protein